MKAGAFAFLLVLALTRAAFADFHALRGAAQTNDIDAARALLEAGTDPNPPPCFRLDTPLIIAARRGHAGMTALLLEYGARTEYRDRNGSRALLVAAELAYMNHYTEPVETIRLLLEAGSPPDADDERHGVSPLIQANIYGGDPRINRLLLAAGANVNRADGSGQTALYGAAGSRTGPESARPLLDAGAEPNIRVKYLDETPLHRTALYGAPETARLLVEAGADIEARQGKGETALFIAAGRGDVGMVDMLLLLGAEVDARDDQGLTPILAAISWRYAEKIDDGHAAAASVLSNRTADIDRAFAAALWQAPLEIAERLLARGADVDAVDHLGRSALAGAVTRGPEWPTRLVAAGVDISRHGGEALGVAARRDATATIHRFLSLGVPADARDRNGATALLHGARHGRVPAVRLLLDHGADPAARDGRAFAAADHMAGARAELEEVIAHAGASKAWIDVSAEEAELARLRAAHAEIAELLGI